MLKVADAGWSRRSANTMLLAVTVAAAVLLPRRDIHTLRRRTAHKLNSGHTKIAMTPPQIVRWYVAVGNYYESAEPTSWFKPTTIGATSCGLKLQCIATAIFSGILCFKSHFRWYTSGSSSSWLIAVFCWFLTAMLVVGSLWHSDWLIKIKLCKLHPKIKIYQAIYSRKTSVVCKYRSKQT